MSNRVRKNIYFFYERELSLAYKCSTTALWNLGRSVWPPSPLSLPRYTRIHYRIIHVRTLITRMGREFSLSHPLLSLSFSFCATLSFLPFFSLSRPGSRVSNLSKTRREARGMIGESERDQREALVYLWCRMMLRFSLLRLEILTPTDFIPDRLIDGDKRCSGGKRWRKRKSERVWGKERGRRNRAHLSEVSYL